MSIVVSYGTEPNLANKLSTVWTSLSCSDFTVVTTVWLLSPSMASLLACLMFNGRLKCRHNVILILLLLDSNLINLGYEKKLSFFASRQTQDTITQTIWQYLQDDIEFDKNFGGCTILACQSHTECIWWKPHTDWLGPIEIQAIK